jgi:O-antigen/teichoic acid export membrane protein
MSQSLYKRLKIRFFGGHERTARVNKNIFYSFFIKGSSIICQFALVPLTLNYLDKTQFGIWLTLSSIISWFSFFDIGIGNGLRNKLSEAIAQNNMKLAKIYVSTSYGLVAGIFTVIMILFWIINPFLDWVEILNTPIELRLELSKMALFVFSLFCLRFILVLIGNVLFAYQQSALNNLLAPLGNILSLLIIYILTITTPSSLLWVAVTFSLTPLLVLLAFNLYFFYGRYRAIAPSIKHIDLTHSKDLLGLGVRFFVIQIAALVLYSSSNVILTQLYGPGEVTMYNIAYRYFTIAQLIYGIITATYWSAFTEAFVKKEFDWIKKSIRRLEFMTYILMGGIVLSTIFADYALHLWVGDSVKIPMSMKIATSLYAIIGLVAAPQHIFINGTGKITLQLYTAIFSIIVTIPMAIVFCKILNFGPSGVVLAMMCTSIPATILYRIQYKKIMNGSVTGIWGK